MSDFQHTNKLGYVRAVFGRFVYQTNYSIVTSPAKELLWWDSSLYQRVIELFFSLVPVVVLGGMHKQ